MPCRFAHFFSLDYFLDESRIGKAGVLPDGRGRSCAYPHPMGPHRAPDRQHWEIVTIDLCWAFEDGVYPREVPLRQFSPCFGGIGKYDLLAKISEPTACRSSPLFARFLHSSKAPQEYGLPTRDAPTDVLKKNF